MQSIETRNAAEELREGLKLIEEKLADKRAIPNFGVRFWDESEWLFNSEKEKEFTIVFNNPNGLKRILRSPTEVHLGEAYIFGDVDVEGDLETVFKLREHVSDIHLGLREKFKLMKDVYLYKGNEDKDEDEYSPEIKGKVHSKNRDKQAVSYHYDTSNAFFKLWLDKNMIYSCAYFKNGDEDIDIAQINKMELICRKLRLKEGEKLLDIGCGWGGLAIYAAQNYGTEVYGITLSQQQADLANERIKELGLSDKVTVEIKDYREIEENQQFDKIVSVGMFEHVGRIKLIEYFNKAIKLLKPGGAFLNHGIAEDIEFNKRTGPSFTQKYVFPDGDLLPISLTSKYAEGAGFEIRDIESLREHYKLTLREWVKRLEANSEQAIKATNEVTYRIWKLFMTGSSEGFESGRLNLYQSLLVKRDKGRHNLPITREDIYKKN
jgi:cyclopropane-fatty-acyl-phospholipid synthase